MKYRPVETLRVSLNLGEHLFEVGRLATVNRKIYFEYASKFMSSGFEISPYRLPLRSGAQAMREPVFDGLFGVFNDSLPDGWGRLLLDRQVQSYGITPEQLGPLDRLTHVGRFGMGALVYEPLHDDSDMSPKQIDLDRIAEESQQVLEGEYAEVVGQLLGLAGSSAGARPKILVGISADRKHLVHGQQLLPSDYEHWMIKFLSGVDQKEAGAVEYAYSLMARASGLHMMPTHLFSAKKKGAGFFGVQRFDRKHNQRIHLHSLAGLAHLDHRVPSMDYDLLLRATQFLTRDIGEVGKAFRLCCFNVFAHNRDDHAKNFAFLMDEQGQWHLSPAYDLTFSRGPAGEHCTTVMGEGKSPGAEHLLKLAAKFGVREAEARRIVNEVANAVLQWHEFANQAGLNRRTALSIAKTLKSIK